MDTARAARAHIIWTSIALLLILIATCLTYVFLPKVPECQRINTLNVKAIESMFRYPASRKHWLLKAYNQTDGHLLWEDEWEHHRSRGESILDHSNTWIVMQEKGVYLVYIQANFILNAPKNSSSVVDLKLLVNFSYGNTEVFSAVHDSRVVKASTSPDANLSTFLLMYMEPTNQLSVTAFPSDMVIYESRPFSTFITIIKLADWETAEQGR